MFQKKFAAVAALVLAAPAAFAQVAVPVPTTQLEAITTSLGGYATVLFGIALAATGIMVGIKWIKRGGRAA